MKFGQLIKYNMRKVFLEKSYSKRGRENIPRPFSKKSKLSIFLDDLIVLIKSFYYMTKKSRQKFKYLENIKNFSPEIKSIFHHYQRIFMEANKIFFLEDGRPTLKSLTIKAHT